MWMERVWGEGAKPLERPRVLLRKEPMEVLGEFVQFLRQEKKWWLIPLIFFLLVLGAILALAGNPVLAPLLYPLF
jgi:Family of unknown function (DUF5989)